ncbi:hypothetical protein K402DRAFT_268978 [Aulographum hederae CBS 113979]|uniref:Telomere repeat-binding factor dimerisation domain-containing protein n=1 Tax=Aulographum hederae CBS 113979 TaxID=1176131 RepID=A0A6G1H802_9PEZI|nr:hypothetical protein K402DRAFT_268978 [Aulographum hederae CBS 113979]
MMMSGKQKPNYYTYRGPAHNPRLNAFTGTIDATPPTSTPRQHLSPPLDKPNGAAGAAGAAGATSWGSEPPLQSPYNLTPGAGDAGLGEVKQDTPPNPQDFGAHVGHYDPRPTFDAHGAVFEPSFGGTPSTEQPYYSTPQSQHDGMPSFNTDVYYNNHNSYGGIQQMQVAPTGQGAIDPSFLPPEPPSVGYFPNVDDTTDQRLKHICILDQMAGQILAAVTGQSVEHVLTVATDQDPSNAEAQAYTTLVALFDSNKAQFVREDIFLNEAAFPIPYWEMIRKVNLATLASTLFSGTGISFQQMDQSFLSLFGRDGSPLTTYQIQLYVELKTQAFIFDYLNGQELRDASIQEYFPMVHSPQYSDISQANKQDLMNRINHRRQLLLTDPNNDHMLTERYSWIDFLSLLQTCIQQRMNLGLDIGSIHNPYTNPVEMSPEVGMNSPHDLNSPHSPFPQMNNPNSTTLAFHNIPSNHSVLSRRQKRRSNTAAGALSSAINAQQQQQQHSLMRHQSGSPSSSKPPLHRLDTNFDFSDSPLGGPTSAPPMSQQQQQNSPTPISPMFNPSLNPDEAMSHSSLPTSAQYNLARHHAITHSPHPLRRVSVPSARRPWSAAEESALMDGLDQVKGPHWSQILALYGEGGSKSNVLRERSQVQLKDKARNLKLFFLKSGWAVPMGLQGVTGDLKSRAPGVARRREKEERTNGMRIARGIISGELGADASAGAGAQGPTSSSASAPASATATITTSLPERPSPSRRFPGRPRGPLSPAQIRAQVARKRTERSNTASTNENLS